MADVGSSVLTSALSAAMPGLGQGLGALGAAMGSTATSGSTAGFDNSGWNVNFGSGSIASDSKKSAGSSVMPNETMYLLAGLGLLLVWRMTRKKG